ncbi:antibiotic biosynthesis monooxygenase family protein [Deinococcus cellulosilyticus]|uniref:Antibiotic biosynthesis monooxygenase n=1 Tax=Deinococcus cellulosilyticus (strain DSM 18568 / NBRC 106333 / KACC 11606 / 5516J-15) TaxID=1223518 RepID=A0A511N3E6_DEIC1|nr:antibiotic biosynthesis monooxygenase [Deinococcus cellulosilyticus]GEM46936.1 antibiotic biosynthesis monooxygenase [Deinococcus cellulosilyticus NBRC 106333 = KACC 11606]
MIAVIFEVKNHPGREARYLDLAADLLPHLQEIEGFISIERFSSLKNPGKLLSLSFWESEEAIKTWRNLELHRLAQQEGRQEVFEHYRLRIASVVRDYSMTEREEAPGDSQQHHR